MRMAVATRVAAIVMVAITLVFPLAGHAQVRPGGPRPVTIGSASIGGGYFVVAGGDAPSNGEEVGVAGQKPGPRPVRFFGFTPEQVTALTERMPYLARAAIRPGVYRGQDMPIGTLQMWNAAIVHKDMPEDFVSELVKTIFSNRDFLESVHPSAGETLPVNLFYIKLPLHPGAVRYFREAGTKLLDQHIPPTG